jgi:hypothetical protein
MSVIFFPFPPRPTKCPAAPIALPAELTNFQVPQGFARLRRNWVRNLMVSRFRKRSYAVAHSPTSTKSNLWRVSSSSSTTLSAPVAIQVHEGIPTCSTPLHEQMSKLASWLEPTAPQQSPVNCGRCSSSSPLYRGTALRQLTCSSCAAVVPQLLKGLRQSEIRGILSRRSLCAVANNHYVAVAASGCWARFLQHFESARRFPCLQQSFYAPFLNFVRQV